MERIRGDYHRSGTFIEFAKQLVDDLHARHFRKETGQEEAYGTGNIKGMHIDDSVIVFEKGAAPALEVRQIGQAAF